MQRLLWIGLIGCARACLGRPLHGQARSFLLASLLLLSAGAPPAQATTPQEAVSALNAQRARNHLPATVALRADWSAACAKHNWYMEMSGDFGHDEDPSSPYYTDEGAWAGKSAVLSRGDDGWPANSPWEHAPIHLHQLLHPALQETGIDVTATRFACAVTWPGYRPANVPVADYSTYSYPGDGAEGVEPAIFAAENPYTPGELIGLLRAAKTGPYLYLFLDGPTSSVVKARVVEASLLSPAGPVDIRVIDSTHPKLSGYIRSGGFIIPLAPLSPHTTYRASATFEIPEGTIRHEFSFTTGEEMLEADRPGKTGKRTRGARRLAARLMLRIHRRGRRVTALVRFRRGHRGRLRVFAKCRAKRTRSRLKLTWRSREAAMLRGRLPACSPVVVVARLSRHSGFRGSSIRRVIGLHRASTR